MYFFFIACKVGWFDNCSQQCIGHCRYNSNCNNVTGRCDKGCAAGWTGTFFDEGKFLFFKALKRKKICKIGGLFNSH